MPGIGLGGRQAGTGEITLTAEATDRHGPCHEGYSRTHAIQAKLDGVLSDHGRSLDLERAVDRVVDVLLAPSGIPSN
jgi:hypothetical protein